MPGAAIWPSAKRASARAAEAVPAMAAATAKPWARDFFAHQVQHRRFAAEQMRRAGDVEHQAVRRIAGDKGTEAVAPVGDAFQQRGIGFFVGGQDAKLAHHRLGIGQRLAFIKAQPFAPAPPAHGHTAHCWRGR